jgi:hypothetical protein
MKTKLFFLIMILFSINANAQVSITINSSIKYQTIEGWGVGGSLFGILNYTLNDTAIANQLNRQTLDLLIDDFGLTGSRMWEVGPRTDGMGMDNGDCDSIDWTKFQAYPTDFRIAEYAVYFKKHLAEQGILPSFYSSPGYPSHATDVKPWVMNHPGERAQQLWANAFWWKNNFGIDINYAVIYNEPSISSTILAEDIKALGPRLIAKGLSTKSQYAEAVTPQNDWDYITKEQYDTEMWPFVGRLSYHNYGNYNNPDPYRPLIRDFAKSKGITTAQTEMYDPNLDNLLSDLTLGGVSYWEVAFSGNLILVPGLGSTSYTPGQKYFRNRQLIHYIRPGAVRIDAVSSDTNVRVVSFIKNELVTTVIINNANAKTINLSGLPAGNYGLSQSTGAAPIEHGILTVDASGTLTLDNVGGYGAITLYPYTGPNHAPAIHIYGSNPGCLILPASAVTLSATATDTELDPITYIWTVVSQPYGAYANIINPNKASTNVTGLTIPGTYIFNIKAKDGTNTSSKKVYLIVYAKNPPAVLGSAGFRFSAPYGLVFTNPGNTTHANIELPLSSAMLQVGIGDLANSDFTGRGKWTLVSAPEGANVTIGETIYIYISIRAQVSGMTVPGDYVFQCNVTDPGYPDLTVKVICTVHPVSSAPVIKSITADPAVLNLSESTTKLTAETIDPEGDLLRHWWAIKSVPVGAKPEFDHQGLPITNVSGLTVPGKYIFTLRVFDDIHTTTKDITIYVKDPISVQENEIVKVDGISIYPNPAKDFIEIGLDNINCGFINPTLKRGVDESTIIQIYNSLGEKVTTPSLLGNATPPTEGNFRIDIESLPTGTYFCKISTNDSFKTVKFVIIK